MANEFIWHDPTEAQQAMTYATNAAKADLAKQENLFRMAELGLRRQQQQETAELNRLITASQLQQRQIDQQFRERELSQRAELERERNKNILEGYKIQFQDRVDPRIAIEQERQKFELDQQKKEEAQDNALIQQWQVLDKNIASLAEKRKGIGAGRSWYEFIDKGTDRKQSAEADLEIGRLRQQQSQIEALLAERGKIPQITPPAASALTTAPPADPRIDAIKREAAAAIQAGANPAAVYQRAAELGVDLR